MPQTVGLFTVETKGNKLIATADLSKVSHETEKSFVIASTRGNQPVGEIPAGKLKGRVFKVGANIFVSK